MRELSHLSILYIGIWSSVCSVTVRFVFFLSFYTPSRDSAPITHQIYILENGVELLGGENQIGGTSTDGRTGDT